MNDEELLKKASFLRKICLQMSHDTSASHIGSIFSMMDILVYIYYSGLLRAEDKFILSKGHAVLGLYAALHDLGVISQEQFNSYRVNGSELIEHPSIRVAGINVSTGSLGHGLAISIGLAMAKPTEHVYCIMGDGECQEGSVWESAIIASRLKLKNLTIVVDSNKYQGYSDSSEQLFPSNIVAKMFAVLNFHVTEIDGHDYAEIRKAFSDSQDIDCARVIIATTIKGKGVSFMENRFEWHYKSPDDTQLKTALKELS